MAAVLSSIHPPIQTSIQPSTQAFSIYPASLHLLFPTHPSSFSLRPIILAAISASFCPSTLTHSPSSTQPSTPTLPFTHLLNHPFLQVLHLNLHLISPSINQSFSLFLHFLQFLHLLFSPCILLQFLHPSIHPSINSSNFSDFYNFSTQFSTHTSVHSFISPTFSPASSTSINHFF